MRRKFQCFQDNVAVMPRRCVRSHGVSLCHILTVRPEKVRDNLTFVKTLLPSFFRNGPCLRYD